MLVSLNQKPYAPNFQAKYDILSEIHNRSAEEASQILVDQATKVQRTRRGLREASLVHKAITVGLPPSKAAQVSQKYVARTRLVSRHK